MKGQTNLPFNRDPITHRKICQDCWDGNHAKGEAKCCRVMGCDCGCKDAVTQQGIESSKRYNRKERKAAATAALEDPKNPLRAENPNYKDRGRRAHA